MVSLIVVKRQGDTSDDITKGIEQLRDKLSLNYQSMDPRNHIYQCKKTQTSVFRLDVTTIDICSSRIRDYIKKQQPLDKSWLPESIVNYLKDYKLYQS